MLPKICAIPECGKKFLARGWCGKHYARWKKFGDPLGATYHPTACAVPGCEVISRTRGWCDNHYRRFLAWGDPASGPPSPGSRSDEERFFQMVEKSAGCWNWMGTKNAVGYGGFKYNGTQTTAHRASWLLHGGRIPEGMQIDHICMNKSCVNPAHIRLATAKQNGEHKGLAKNNTSGYRGVQRGHGSKWRAVVGHNGKHHHLGSFEDIEEANAAAVSARNELFTHNDLDRIAS